MVFLGTSSQYLFQMQDSRSKYEFNRFTNEVGNLNGGIRITWDVLAERHIGKLWLSCEFCFQL